MYSLHRRENPDIGLKGKKNYVSITTLKQVGQRLPVMTRRDSELPPEPALLPRSAHCRCGGAEERNGRS
jgi:hypothetical protein